MRPLYVAFEGVKGCGKSTVIRGVREALSARGLAVNEVGPTHAAPCWSPLELLARVPAMRRQDAFEERLYRARARFHGRRLQRVRGGVVLGDRSILTPVVTRWHRAEEVGPNAWIERCIRGAPELRPPDAVLWLDLPPAVAALRCRSRGRTYGQHDEQLAALTRTREVYEHLMRCPYPALRDVHWTRLDAKCEPHAVTRAALSALEPLIAGLSHE